MEKYVGPRDKYKSPNQYLIDVINENRSIPISIKDYRIQKLLEYIYEWGGRDIFDIFVSGSSAKGTSLIGSSDLDLFVSLKASNANTLKVLFHSLKAHLENKGLKVRPQNVSLRITYYNLKIDIVPGKKLPNQVNWHFLHTNRREDQDRIQTNVVNHLNHVLNSNRVNEIVALKIWRERCKIDFPSMYLEMYTIKALSGKWTGKAYLASNVHYVLEHIAKYFRTTAVYDPSNGTNIISNTLWEYEKKAIQLAAERSVKKDFWNEIIF